MIAAEVPRRSGQPLRGQYADDERKLIFFQEAEQLFDPLRVRVCPACMQDLAGEVELEPGGTCSLCRQDVAVAPEPIDIGAERAVVRARLQAIERYIGDVERQLGEAHTSYEAALALETAAQRRLDSEVAQDLSPFLAQRDELVRQREEIRGERHQLTQQIRWHEGLERRNADAAQIELRISELRERIDNLRGKRPDRRVVTQDLTERFADLLREFGFPKLNEPSAPYLSDSFVPFVRGNRYTDIGSTGALTLISLAWQLAIFERAVEQGQPHPGFLMIDSPQKNLMPEIGAAPADDFADPAIPRRLWEHILSWSSSMGPSAQVIVVDNRPPDLVDPHVVVRYSGRGDEPPYGLIDDETGTMNVPDTGAHVEDIDFVFRPFDVPDTQARVELAREFHGAIWDQPVRGVLGEVAALALTGSVSLSVLATTIVRLTCHIRKRGAIIDLRKADVEISEDPATGPGYLLIVDADGSHELVDVCLQPVDLAAVLAAAMNRAPGSG